MTECPSVWLSHGCDLKKMHWGDHLCLNRNYEGGGGSMWDKTSGHWCQIRGTMDFYDLCDFRPQGHPDLED